MQNKFKLFFDKYNNKFVERWDVSNLNQCADLMVAWLQELGLSGLIPLGFVYAYELWTKTPTKLLPYFERILNTTDAIPQVGDIVIWSNNYGSAGHVAISNGEAKVENKSTDWFRAFSQNDPLKSPSVLKTYSFNYVYGWLRFKGTLPTDPLQECLAQHTDLVNQCGLLKKQLTEKDLTISTFSTNLLKTQQSLDEATQTIEGLEKEVEDKEKLRLKWWEALQQANTNLDSCKKDRATFQSELTQCLNREVEITWGELLTRVWNKIRNVKI